MDSPQARPGGGGDGCGARGSRRPAGGPWRTQLFVTLTIGQLVAALVLRPAGAWRRSAGRSAGWVPVAVTGSVLLLLAAVYAPPLRILLDTDALTPAQLAVSAGAALAPALGLVGWDRAGRISPAAPVAPG